MTADESWLPFDVDLSFLPGAEQIGARAPVRGLGRLARVFAEEGGPPPLPKPTIGVIDGVELPLFYPGLNGIAGPPGVGKSLLLKYLLAQQVRLGNKVLVLDCESSEQEYASTLLVDFGMVAGELDLVHYVTNKQGNEPRFDHWDGRLDGLAEVLAIEADPTLVVIDSQSKSMAQLGMDENRPIDTSKWYTAIPELLLERWPEMAVVAIQGRQKGWFPGMDVRQGRGSSSLLHEVTCQYMLWTKTQGSRYVDGSVKVVSTKCRYGHRLEGATAALWHYGPAGFVLDAEVAEDQLTDDEIREAVLSWFAGDPRDPLVGDLPPDKKSALSILKEELKLKDATALTRVLEKLLVDGLLLCEKVVQSKRGVRPYRVWSPEAGVAEHLKW